MMNTTILPLHTGVKLVPPNPNLSPQPMLVPPPPPPPPPQPADCQQSCTWWKLGTYFQLLIHFSTTYKANIWVEYRTCFM